MVGHVLLNTQELAARFGRTQRAVTAWRQAGAPGFRLIGSRIFGDPELIEAWLRRCAIRPGPKADAAAVRIYQRGEVAL